MKANSIRKSISANAASTAKRKLKSQRGASLSIALLLFLVCTVLGSIILRAATVAAGRQADLAKSDKIYYATTSAAEFLANAMDGHTITFEKTKTDVTTVKSTYQRNEDGDMKFKGSTETSEPTKYITKALKDTSGKGSTLLTEAVKEFMNCENTESAWKNDGSKLTVPKSMTGFELNHETGMSALDAEVEETIQENGLLIFTVKNKSDSAGDYKVQFTLLPGIRVKSKTSQDSSEAKETTDANNYTITETFTETTTKTIEVTWTLVDMAKVS